MRDVFDKSELTGFYFTGGAHGGIYHMGALEYIKKHVKLDNINLYGNSAGAIALVLSFLYNNKDSIMLYLEIMDKISKTIAMNPYKLESYEYIQYVQYICGKIKNDFPDAYNLVNGKIHIGVTKQTGFEWISEFESNEELFNVLTCSCHVPLLSKYNAQINGIKCVDGCIGFCYERDLPERTLIVCPRNSKVAHLNGKMTPQQCVAGVSSDKTYHFYRNGRRAMKRYLTTGAFTKQTDEPYEETVDEHILPDWCLAMMFNL
jgi:hypothetical protein